MCQSRNWCWTENNYGELPDQTKFKYICWGKEVGADGTRHLQGYFAVKEPITLTRAKLLLPRAHLEIMRGTCEQARDYCKKGSVIDGLLVVDFVEFGVFSPGQGCRTDIRGAVAQIMNGATMREIDPMVYVRYNRGLQALKLLHSEKRNWKTEVFVYWGKPGTGKTRLCMELGGMDAYWKQGNPKWWDGYDGQETVIISEFSWFSWCENRDVGRNLTLDIFDRYPVMVEMKGGSTQFLATRIFLGTNENPLEQWPLELLRRVTVLPEVV